MDRKTRKSRAKSWHTEHSQSQMSKCTSKVFSNIITGDQHLPARRRDFKVNLPFGYQHRRGSDVQLSHALSRMVKFRLLKHETENLFPFSVGRNKLYLASERRGRRDSYYLKDRVKDIIEEVLNDESALRSITNSLISNELFHDFLNYIFIKQLHLLKNQPDEFFSRYSPYGLDKNNFKILPPDEEIEKEAKRLASNYVEKLRNDNGVISGFLYTIAGLLFFGKAYSI